MTAFSCEKGSGCLQMAEVQASEICKGRNL